ncbi:protein disulfide isomerase II DsbC [Halomonas elongata]|uniref:Thiol:disulfide interchange protein DsbC n=1 Tax=Halomonas elongata TaxID=2746 RepID=A0A1B8NY60_HALEL|nr:disulfide isomerase DsbC N-terminal domain-containing protein [Halomonas elongata]OBX34918.1 protein disulfide isomerase II DsbC [Halomonas elongata]
MNKPLSQALLGLSLAMPWATTQAVEIPEAVQSLELGGQPANPTAIEPAPMEEWYEVRLRTGETLYTDAEARYVLVGELFENGEDQVINLSEQQRREQRLESLAELDEYDSLTYPADGDVKGEMTVFTDISCPYCQQLHQDIPNSMPPASPSITCRFPGRVCPPQWLIAWHPSGAVNTPVMRWIRPSMDSLRQWVMKPKCVGHDWRKAFHWPSNLGLGGRRPRYSPTASSERGIGQ